jgi:hypothetical protein
MRRPAIIFVFITIVLDMLALGMIIPVLPKLRHRVGTNAIFLLATFGRTV